MEIILKPKAMADLSHFKKSGNKVIQMKISALLYELELSPEVGTGKPEQLKNKLSGYWSRRINGEHRIVYTIDYELNIVEIYSLKGHYEKLP